MISECIFFFFWFWFPILYYILYSECYTISYNSHFTLSRIQVQHLLLSFNFDQLFIVFCYVSSVFEIHNYLWINWFVISKTVAFFLDVIHKVCVKIDSKQFSLLLKYKWFDTLYAFDQYDYEREFRKLRRKEKKRSNNNIQNTRIHKFNE